MWELDLEPARDEVIAFAEAVHAGGKGEQVLLVAADEEAAERGAAARGRYRAASWSSRSATSGCAIPARSSAATASRPISSSTAGAANTICPATTISACGWRRRAARRCESFNWILEGGAIDGDGTGLVVTTEQCLLNRNRNGAMTRGEIEELLYRDLGYDEVLWLGDGLLHDHTDGHVDNLARFVAPRTLAVPEASDNDPNWQVYQRAAQRAAGA